MVKSDLLGNMSSNSNNNNNNNNNKNSEITNSPLLKKFLNHIHDISKTTEGTEHNMWMNILLVDIKVG